MVPTTFTASDNGQWAGSIDLGTHPGNFQIAGAGDFNGAGSAGVLWRASP